MKRTFAQISQADSLDMPSVFTSSSSSDGLGAYTGYANTSTQFINGTQRNVRRRRVSPQGTITTFPTTYTANLQEILTRYHNWSTAVATGNTGASEKSLAELNHFEKADDSDQVCTLCLDNINIGETYTKLSCGHVFHRGSKDGCSNGESSCCRGILYWLKSNLTCPHCRIQLEPAVPIPSASEQVIVPLLNRQFALIQAQARLIERQRRELQTIQRDQTVQKKRNRTAASSASAPDRFNLLREQRIETTPEPPQPFLGSAQPQTLASNSQWQNGTEHHAHRVEVLNIVTKIAISALNWRLIECTDSKMRKLNTLAAKVELLLFSEAGSLEEYRNLATLRTRVLNKIRSLIWRAKQLRRVRHSSPITVEAANPLGSLVF